MQARAQSDLDNYPANASHCAGNAATRTLVTPPISSKRVATRFGPSVDVRHRDVLKASIHPQVPSASSQHLAVVRLWSGDNCRELSVTDARAFAAELIAAAAYAEHQNRPTGADNSR